MKQPNRDIAFELKGKLPPEQFVQLSTYVAELALTQTIELKERPDLEQTEELYNTEYLDLVYIPEQESEAYLVTAASFRRYFRQNDTQKNSGMIDRAWHGLSEHLTGYHAIDDPKRPSLVCNCGLHGVIDSRYFEHERWRQARHRLLGVPPDNLVAMSSLLVSRNQEFKRISPQAAGAISLYVGGLVKIPEGSKLDNDLSQ